MMAISSDTTFKLLLVEDNPGDIMLIRKCLESISPEIHVDVGKTYLQAEELLSDGPENYDVILLDLKLPDKEGEELIREIIKRSNTAPVIVLTGYSDMHFSVKSVSLGVADYILKDELNAHGLWKSIRYSIERNMIYRKLKESERRYRYLFENNPTSILIWNIENRKILDSNNEAENKYGFSKQQLNNLKIDDIHPNGSVDYFNNNELNFTEGSDLNLNEHVVVHKKSNGEIFFAEIKGHFIMYQEKPSVLFLINDVTDKIELQERLIESSLRAEEEERNRIAKELHDGIVQQLVACGMFAQNISNKVDDITLTGEVNRLYDLLIKTTIHTRDLSHNLKSAEFEQMTIPELINQLVKQLTMATSIEFTFNNHLDYETKYDNSLKINIYRSLQELCNNIVKHSEATRVKITIEEVDKVLYITIKDNGHGFDFNNPDNIGFGIKNVESRMKRLGGTIIYSKPGKNGFQADLEIPVNLVHETESEQNHK